MHREIVALVVLSAVVVMCFVLTRAAARANRAFRLRDAAVFYHAGEDDLQRGRTASAITALRRAAALSRDNRTYRLALAAGLSADHQDDSARQVLLGVRDSAPEDPEVNVRLARLEARHDDLTNAVRYYQNALYGSWHGDQVDARRQVRIELIRFFLAHHQDGRALSELLVLAGNLPDEVKSQNEAGRLFLQAGDAGRALDHFRQALRIDPTDATALAGAREAAFAAGDYVTAQRYFRRVETASSRVTELRAIAGLVLSNDPLQSGLSLRQRHERVILGLARAMATLDECVKQQPARSGTFESVRAEAHALEPQLDLEKVRRHPETIDAGVDVIYRAERRAAELCGPGSVFDRALLLIGRRHEHDRQ